MIKRALLFIAIGCVLVSLFGQALVNAQEPEPTATPTRAPVGPPTATPSFEIPRPIRFGIPVSGEIAGAVFRNYWNFDARAGSIVDIRMVADSGDLDPFVSLLSPLGDILVSNDSATGGRDAGILAFQLPFTGEYRILVRRAGPNGGRGGTTNGRYTLTLDLRSPGTAAQNTLIEPGRAVFGRLTENAPVAVYRIEGGGRLALRLDLSTADRLARLRLISTGGSVLAEFTGTSPLLVPTSLPAGVAALIEASAPSPEKSGNLDFSLAAFRMSSPPENARPLTVGDSRQSEGGGPESWFFTGSAGDMMQLTVHPLSVQAAQNTEIRVFNAQNAALLQGVLGVGLEGVFTLPNDGLYEISVRPAGNTPAAYRVALRQLGANRTPFDRFAAVPDLPTPPPNSPFEASLRRGEAIAYPLDATAGTVISVRAGPLNGADSVGIAIQNPAGGLESVAVSRSEREGIISRAVLAQTGRYRLLVFDAGVPRPPQTGAAAAPQPLIAYRIAYALKGGGVLQPGALVKGVVSPADALATWRLEVPTGATINLRLENLTPIAWEPRLFVADPDGRVIAESGTEQALFGVLARLGGTYTIVISGAVNGNYASYRLENSLQFPFAVRGGRTVQIEPAVALPDAGRYAPPPPEGAVQTNLRALISPLVSPQTLPAEQIGTLAFGRTVRGEIPAGALVGAWRINVASDVVIQVQASALSRAEGPGLTLWNAAGQLIDEQFRAGEATTTLTTRIVRGGQYVVVVSMGLDGGRYLLSLENVGLVTAGLQIAAGKPIQYGQSVSGEILSAGETDTYYFSAALNDVISAQVFRSSGTFVPGLELRGPTGRLITQSDSVTERAFALLAGVRLPEAGVYRLTVQNRNQVGRSEGRYRLYLGLEGGIRAVGRGGGEIRVGQTQIGRLGIGNDSDDWLFEALEGQSVTFTAQAIGSPAPNPLTLQLLDTTGGAFATQTVVLAGGVARLEGILLPGTGLYRARVTGGTASGGLYRLTWEADSGRAAGVIRYGQTVSGLFTAQRRAEAWTFSGTAGDSVTVAMRYQRGTPFTGSFQIQAANGVILATVADFDQNGAQADVQLPFSGAYTILTGNPDPAFAGVGVYRLTVTLRESSAASAGGVLRYGQTAIGRLTGADPTDTWVFSARAGDRVRIALSGRDSFFRPLLELRTPSDSPLATAQAEGGLPIAQISGEGAELVIAADGAYVIHVGAVAGGLGAYLLSLDFTPAPVADIERLTYGGSANGVLADDRPEESYLFSGESGDLITASARRESGADLSLILAIRAPDGTLIARDDSNDSDVAAIEGLRLPVTGTYRLVVSRFGGVTGQTAGRYTVALVGAAAARPVRGTTRYGAAAIGRLSDSTPLDRISFTGRAGDVIGITGMATSGDLDITLALEGADGVVLATNDDTNGTDAAISPIQLPADGDYIVAVGRAGASAGNYTLNVNLLYQGAAPTLPPNAVISYGERLTGALDNTVREAAYTFVGVRGDVIAVQMLHQNDDAPPLLRLQDPAGRELANGQLTVGATTIERFRLPADGRYTLVVRRPANAQAAFTPFALALGLADAQAAGGLMGGILNANGLGEAITGAFAPGQTAHYWLFSGAAGQGVTVSLLWLGGEGLPSALVLAPDGRALSTLRLPTRGAAAATADLSLPVDGVYTILVLPGGGSAGGYRLGVQVTNDPPDNTETLTSGIATEGALSAAIPARRYQFVGGAGQSLSAQMLAISDGLLPRLTLADSNGRVLAESTLTRTGQGTAGGIVGFTLPTAGEFTLTAEGEGGSSGTYRLLIVLSTDNLPISAEAAAARRIAYNQPVRGTLQSGGTTLYAFIGQRGDSVAVAATLNSGQKPPRITVKDVTGRALILAEPSAAANVPETAIPVFDVPDDGRYIVAIEAESSIAYTLVILRRNDFAPSAAVRPALRPLPFNTPQQNGITNTDIVDYWSFDGTAGQALQIDVQRLSGTLRPDVSLYGPSGFVAAGAAAFGSGDLTFGPLRLPNDGPYTLVVTRWLGAAGNTTGNYRVRLTPLEAAAFAPIVGGVIPAYGRTVTGAVSQPLPAEVWAFDGMLGDVVDIEIAAAGSDLRPQVQITAPGMETSPPAEVNGSLRVVLPATGRYGLTVSGAGGTFGAYRLRLIRAADAGQAAVGQAAGITYGEAREGRLGAATPALAWVLFARAGERLIAEAAALDGELDPYLRLIGPDGATLATDDNSGGGLTARITNVVIPVDGFYALVVSASPLGANKQGHFRLLVMRGQPGAAYQGGVERGVTVAGVLSAERTLQEWHFTTTAESEVVAVQVVAGGAAFRGRILLVTDDGKLIGAAAGNRLEVTLPGAGRYRILIGGGAGAYRLTVDSVQRPE